MASDKEDKHVRTLLTPKKTGADCPYLQSFADNMLRNAIGDDDIVPCSVLYGEYLRHLHLHTSDIKIITLGTKRRFYNQFKLIALSKGWMALNRNPYSYRLRNIKPHRLASSMMVRDPAHLCVANDNALQFITRPPPSLDIEIKAIPGKGYGVVARKELRKDQILCEYVGQEISSAEAKLREQWYEDRGLVPRMITLQQTSTYLDGYRRPTGEEFSNIHGNIGSMLNHSRIRPNSRLMLIRHESRQRILLITTMSVAKSQELLWDYSPRDVKNQPAWMNDS